MPADQIRRYNDVAFLASLQPARNSCNLNFLKQAADYTKGAFAKPSGTVTEQAFEADGYCAHGIFTAVRPRCGDGRKGVFSGQTTVHFQQLRPVEINLCIATAKPLDKARAYGAPDWLGMVGMVGLEDSPVMGLPKHCVWGAPEKPGALLKSGEAGA